MSAIEKAALRSMFDLIDAQSPIMTDSLPERGFRLCEPIAIGDEATPVPIANDTKAPPVEHIPTFDLNSSWAGITQPNRDAMAEANYIASLFEGCPHAIGVLRAAEYERSKQTAQHIEKGRSRHA